MTITLQNNKCTSASVDETLAVGELLGRLLTGGLVIGLVGPLGAGKTQLVKGMAIGNGLDDAREVTSPTFTLVHEYPGKLPLFHLDAYRLSKPEELVALGATARGLAHSGWVLQGGDAFRLVL